MAPSSGSAYKPYTFFRWNGRKTKLVSHQRVTIVLKMAKIISTFWTRARVWLINSIVSLLIFFFCRFLLTRTPTVINYTYVNCCCCRKLLVPVFFDATETDSKFRVKTHMWSKSSISLLFCASEANETSVNACVDSILFFLFFCVLLCSFSIWSDEFFDLCSVRASNSCFCFIAGESYCLPTIASIRAAPRGHVT